MMGVVDAFVDAINRHDGDALEGLFGESAVVVDQTHEYAGAAARREWIANQVLKPSLDIVDLEPIPGRRESAGAALNDVFEASVIGNFLGAPRLISFKMTTSDHRIQRLEVTAGNSDYR